MCFTNVFPNCPHTFCRAKHQSAMWTIWSGCFMTSLLSVPTQGQAKTKPSEDAMAKHWPGEFHLAVKGGVPITNQSIPWAPELTQLECDTLQLQSEGEHCRLPPGNAPTHWHYNQPLPALWGGGQTHRAASRSCNTERLDPASVQSQTQSIIQSRTSFSPVACAKQGLQWIQTRLLKALSQVLEVLPGKPVEWHRTRQATGQKVSRISVLFANTSQMYCNITATPF